MPGKLFLIPNLLDENAPSNYLPSYIGQAVRHVRYFMAENERSARRLLKLIDPQIPVQECVFFELSEHTADKEAQEFFKEHAGEDIGIISEAGVPCVADPGAQAVLWAHEAGKDIVPLIGPSSVLLALMASGLNGQNFAFNGYLPKDKAERIKKLQQLEKRTETEGQTQIFMETPYRNEDLLEEIWTHCRPQTLLTIAAALTGPEEFIKTKLVKDWKGQRPPLHKKPVLFLIGKRA